jgi:hypothetical protein
LLPVPIPSDTDQRTLEELRFGDVDAASIIADLSKGTHTASTKIHLDPDLHRNSRNRLPGWRPAFGQGGAAQGHLKKLNVGPGDVFVFFGWFRRVEQIAGRWRYMKGAPDIHVAFGWLEVANVLPIVIAREACLEQFPWVSDHPHAADPSRYSHKSNTIYIAAAKSRFLSGKRAGGGLFARYSRELQFTEQGQSRSIWSLPRWFMPAKGRAALSYHEDPSRWARTGQNVQLRTAARGQEFVLDLDKYPKGIEWVTQIIRHGADT